MASPPSVIDLVLEQQHVDADDEDRQFGLFADLPDELRRGRGRPAGSRNKHTVKTVEFLLSRARDPRLVLLEIAQASVDEIVALAKCDRIQALQEKRLAATAVLPYVASKMPLAIDLTRRSVVYLKGELFEPGPRGDDDAGAGLVAVLENVVYQELSDLASDSPISDNG